ncbi:MAG: cytochrome c biogenesis protein ResB [Desulfobacterales bacterium]|nr:cytochrome c biogenesis protein ResB [Desulfobacterales bacterium]
MNKIWKLFSSVQVTVVVLLTLAGTSVIGTLIPQNERPLDYVQAYGEFGFKLFSVLGLFDMYHAWWFLLLLLILTVNIIVCSVDRFPAAWKLVSRRKKTLNAGRFRKLSNYQTVTTSRSPGELQPAIEKTISLYFRKLQIESMDSGFLLFAEKRRWSRLGVYVVHTSIVLLLLGSIIGSIYGFEGFVNIPEGEAVDTIQLRNSSQTHKLDFSIRCDDFDVSFYENGAPREYRSDLTLLEDGKPVHAKSIVVNDPVRYRGINIFQSSYGQVPAETITLGFTSKETGMVYQEKMRPGQSFEIPEKLGTLKLQGLNREANFKGHSIGPAYMATLTGVDGHLEQILLPVRFPSFDRMRKGDAFIAITAQEEKYYTGLQVTRDPGVWVVYTGFILMLAGCFITFFMSHQQLMVAVENIKEETRIGVSGIANKNKLGMDGVVEKLAQLLAEESGAGNDHE